LKTTPTTHTFIYSKGDPPVEYSSVNELIDKSMENKRYERPYEYRFVWSILYPIVKFTSREDRKRIRILDVGGAESYLSKMLSELGFDVTVIDINDFDYGNARFIKANLLDYEFPGEYFDLILAVSTIEHVGLPCYGQDKIVLDGDKIVADKIHRWLKRSGLAIVTVPYGIPHHPPTFERVYTMPELKQLFPEEKWEWILAIFACDPLFNGMSWMWCSEIQSRHTDACCMMLLRKR